jgi:hypothetical protein
MLLTPAEARATVRAMRSVPDVAGRLELSERTISAWEHIGVPGGRAEDNLRMIHEELQALDALLQRTPGARDAIADLTRRYGEMANKIRLKTS